MIYENEDDIGYFTHEPPEYIPGDAYPSELRGILSDKEQRGIVLAAKLSEMQYPDAVAAEWARKSAGYDGLFPII